MSLRFLVDECAGHAIVAHLRHLGYDVITVAEMMPGADDNHVLAAAHEQQRILVTADKDFGDKVFREQQPHAGILLIRPPDNFTATKIRILDRVLHQYASLLNGNFVVATDQHIRIRRGGNDATTRYSSRM